MATMASTLLLLAARKASLASRAAAAAASRAAAMASRSARAVEAAAAARSARAAGIAAAAARAARLGLPPFKMCGEASTKARDGSPRRLACAADYSHLPDDARTPTDKDFESDEALRSLYERWCKAFNKERDQRDHAEMNCRFKLFRYSAKLVHKMNTSVPADPEEAAIYRDKRREAKLLLSKGEGVSHLDECYLPVKLCPFADGGHPYFDEYDMDRLKYIEEEEASLGKSQTLNEID